MQCTPMYHMYSQLIGNGGGRLKGVYVRAQKYMYACPNNATNAGRIRGGVGEGKSLNGARK